MLRAVDTRLLDLPLDVFEVCPVHVHYSCHMMYQGPSHDPAGLLNGLVSIGASS